ncbi:ATP-dependent DNA helicase [Bifidobacterium simiarum]|uniref:ATP-dependent DNA helicase n=1 Tax=Bifidobacterium simiarum TaxID=2045441 RepID=UPI001BDD5AD4|nr:ATP-dependent DNA helicase [Bifidobacterium simiarum]MBT1166111.1 UvrD-helicase domain-containing protein [Bifidobacterium simiarum]
MIFVPTEEQSAVIDAPVDDNVLVVAGAGSGKTFTMTRRIIALIEQGVPAERILGLTFTRKAASELLSRVSAAVLGSTTSGASAAGGDPDRAFLKPEIFTYDAFFQSIVRQYGLLVGMDQNTQPLSAAGAYQLASDVIGRHMDLLFGGSGASDGAGTSDGAGSSAGGPAAGSGSDASGEDMGAFSTVVDRMLTLSSAIASSMIGGDCMSFHDAVTRIRRWDSAFERRLVTLIGDREVPDQAPKTKYPTRRKKDTDEDWAAKLADYERNCRQLMVFNANTLLGVVRRREILLTLAEEFQEAKRRENMAEFSDFTIAAYQLVRRFPSIGAEYRRRYSHVFLDEYQDTSTTQASLLAALFHVDGERGLASGPTSAVNAVGDPFQSIYAWRGASPGAFRMFQRDFGMDATGGASAKPRPLSLTRRNSRLVLEAANDLTIPLRQAPKRPGSSLMREVDVPALTCLPDADLGTLGVLGFTNLGQEIDAVVRFAHQVIAQIDAETEGSGRGEAARSAHDSSPHVAVLFRSKIPMPRYRAALEASGLTCEVVGYSALLEQPQVRDLLALLHAVSDHTDSASLMRLLATPRFGLGSDDLTALAGLAERANLEYRYRALAEAGVVPADMPRERWSGLVSEHRDRIPNGVFLADVLLGDDLAVKLTRSFSERGRRLILRAASVLRDVERAMHRPLPDVIRCAVEALDLDIDTVVAQAIASGGVGDSPTVSQSPIQAILDLTASYMQEIPETSSPSLRGFMAWVDALGTVPETAAAHIDEHVDVTLMSIHQSKGLEWDAVAIVGMKQRAFPSSQGDYLSVKPDPDQPGGVRDGVWTPPQYRESAHVWLEDPTAVPVPVRADAGILPRFPHDMDVNADTTAGAGADADAFDLDEIDSLERLQREVFGFEGLEGFEALMGETDSSSAEGGSGMYLSQREEYGRRLHADERRLAYVALTRARKAALLTFSATGDESAVPAPEAKPLDAEAKASNFWMEMHEAFVARPEAVREPTGIDMNEVDRVRKDAVAGFFIGDHAQDYENAVIGGQLTDPSLGDDAHADDLPWPSPLGRRTVETLRASARAVTEARRHMTAQGEDGNMPASGGLLDYARQMTAMRSDGFGADGETDAAALDVLRNKGERILAGSRQNVTAIQARAGMMDDHEALTYWSGIVRPIPRVASPNAQAGTLFHDWAARFLLPQDIGGENDGGALAETRQAMIDELDAAETSAAGTGTAGAGTDETNTAESKTIESNPDELPLEMLRWRRRLASSPWAGRRVVAVERPIVADIGGLIVNGKLDAVFEGGIDPHDETKRLTVIDWKTGARPRTAPDVRRKLAQLDMYRLLLSRLEGIPLDAIDAALYYVSVADEHQRQLRAEPKTEAEIIAEMALGLPEQSDDD